MVGGLSEPLDYEYRIELHPHDSSGAVIAREFTSTFEASC